MLNFLESKSIDFANQEELIEYFYNKMSPSCEMSFSNLKMWGEVYKTKMVKFKNDFIFFSQHDQMIYFPIIEDMDLDLLLLISKDFQEQNIIDKVTFYDVNPDFIAKYPETLNHFDLEDDIDSHDYLYSVEKLANLTGSKLKKKRNLVNQFENLYPNYYIEKISDSNYNLAYDLAQNLNKKLEHNIFIDEEDLSMEFAFQNFEKLLLNGFILYAEKESPVGFSVYSKLNNDYADIHYEKANHEIKGGSQMLTTLLAKELLAKGFKFMNREQDLGHLGIRKAKLSLDPIDFYKRVKLIAK